MLNTISGVKKDKNVTIFFIVWSEWAHFLEIFIYTEYITIM